MDLFFSPPVKTYSLLSSHHQACLIVQQLISTGHVQFQLEPYDDSNDPYYIIFARVKTLKHKILKMIQTIQGKYGESIPLPTKQQKKQIIGKMKDYMDEMQLDHLKYLDKRERQIQQKIRKFHQLSKIYDSLLQSIQRNQEQIQMSKIKSQTIKSKDFSSQEFTLLTGSCFNKQRYMLQRLIFRKSHGHAYCMFVPKQKDTQRSIFLCFINKGVYKHIDQKIQKIFVLNNVVLYDLPNMEKNLLQHQETLKKQNSQLEKVLVISGQQLTEALRQKFIGTRQNLYHQLTRISYLERLLYIVCHSKKIGHPPNYIMFTIHIPGDKEIPKLPASLIPADNKKSSKKRTILPRLECLKQVNMLTQLYSIPKHNQILPSIFMFSTVPILFGMMFSDFGHGSMLLALCFTFKLAPIFYFMSFMSIYCGVIYNEFFGMKILRSQEMGILHGEWGAAQNGLNFQNSLKMKISMIMAFIHMTFGLILKIVNQSKRSQTGMIIYDSLPKLGLLLTFVGYLVLLIISKWLTDYSGIQSTAPSIINSMLELYLGWNQKRKHSILGSIQFQKRVGSWMTTLSVLFILVMVYNHTIRHSCQDFFTKIFSKNKKYNKLNQRASYQKLQDQQFEEQIQQISQELQQRNKIISKQTDEQLIKRRYYFQEDSHESELGPLQVFQYVLSLISSTTSYLRLFALSLAHAKLSHLLLTFLLGGLSGYEPSLSFGKCLIFFVVTIGMMLVLDVMQCMMHVVRLHWVEWMGKFYQGGGKIFAPQVQQDF